MPDTQASRSKQKPRSVGLTTSMLAGLLAVLASLCSLPLLGVAVPLWIQPSVVGLLWGSLFLSGCWLAFAQHGNFLSVATVVLGSSLFVLAFRTITDLSTDECLLASVVLVGSGWILFRFGSSHHATLGEPSLSSKVRQISLSDLFVATTLTACAVSSISQISDEPVMLVSILGTLVVGCFCSWASCQWACNDVRPVGIPLLLVALLLTTSFLFLHRLTGFSAPELAQWLLQGPLSVIAAQCFTILAALAILRQHPLLPLSSKL